MFNTSFTPKNPGLRRGAAITSIAALSLAAPLLIAGCSTQDSTPAKTSTSATSATSADRSKKTDSKTEAEHLTAQHAWAKASQTGMIAGEGMTGLFVTLTNSSDKDIKIVGGTSKLASMVELHEVVDGKMQKKDGGFVVPAGGSLELAPGALHIMLMGMEKPILAGDDAHVTIEMGDGSTVDIHALVKDSSGANETYSGDDEHSEGSSENDAPQ